MRVIAEQGYAGATQRSIAAEAGVSAASTHYFFDSVEELIREAATAYLEERLTFYEQAIDTFAAGDHDIADGCRQAAVLLSAVSTEARSAQFEIYLNAQRQPLLQATVLDSIERLEALVVRLLEVLQVPEPGRWTTILLSIGDGFALRAVAGAPAPVEALERALLAIAAAAQDAG